MPSMHPCGLDRINGAGAVEVGADDHQIERRAAQCVDEPGHRGRPLHLQAIQNSTHSLRRAFADSHQDARPALSRKHGPEHALRRLNRRLKACAG